jgi:uncharacterized repeat protein (TIGR03803 family)
MRPKRTGCSIKLPLNAAVAFLILASAALVEAQTIQTIYSFTGGSDGASPSLLTLGSDGNLYGTTASGGSSDAGTVFKVTTNGTLTTLVSFRNTFGDYPSFLTLGSDGNLYGTTSADSSYIWAAVFRVTTSGMLNTLFSSSNYICSMSALIQGSDGNYYGTTFNGVNGIDATVFKVTTNGLLTTLVSFPNYSGKVSALTQGSDGNFYGTTSFGGSSSDGTIFQVTTNGLLNTLVVFNGYNGSWPNALTLGNDGNFYGTTSGSYVFKVTTNGVMTTLTTAVTFPSTLTLGSDGNFYGTTSAGGSNGNGTVFLITTNGTLTTLASFINRGNATSGSGALTLGADGNLYGTTEFDNVVDGNPSGAGTVFRVLLPPIITSQPEEKTNYAGTTATFLVGATSLTPIGYQWQKNGTNLADGGNLSGANTDTLTIGSISDADAAVYSVIVTNPNFSVTSSSVTLTVNDLPFIASQPQSQAVLAGSNATFNVTAYGAPPFVFQWYFNGTPFGLPAAGTNFSSCTLTNVGGGQAGNYSVEVVNGYGSVTSSNATLTVVNLPPTITMQPASRTNNAGTTATFSVVASSLSPLGFQWQKSDTNLANGGNISGATNSTLTITSVSDGDAAIYSVVVTNLAGSVISSNAVLTVIDQPSITAQPLGQRVLLGSSASFSVSVSGTPPFSYRWRFNGSSLLNATNSAYAIQAVGTNNTGNYSVVVTNLAGSVTSSNAFLTVMVPPTLALQLLAGYPVLNLDGMLGNNFVVQYSTNLAGTNWLNLLSLTNLPSSPYLFLDPAGDGKPARFYRAFMQ